MSSEGYPPVGVPLSSWSERLSPREGASLSLSPREAESPSWPRTRSPSGVTPGSSTVRELLRPVGERPERWEEHDEPPPWTADGRRVAAERAGLAVELQVSPSPTPLPPAPTRTHTAATWAPACTCTAGLRRMAASADLVRGERALRVHNRGRHERAACHTGHQRTRATTRARLAPAEPSPGLRRAADDVVAWRTMGLPATVAGAQLLSGCTKLRPVDRGAIRFSCQPAQGAGR